MKAAYAGAGVALAAGLLLGGAMKPTFAADDRPAGPQVVEDWAATAVGPFDDDRNTGAHSGQVADSVAGADPQVAAADPPKSTRASREDPADHVTAYAGDEGFYPLPTDDAGTYENGAHDTAAAADPAWRMARPADLDPEAPPEATGDTTRAAG